MILLGGLWCTSVWSSLHFCMHGIKIAIMVTNASNDVDMGLQQRETQLRNISGFPLCLYKAVNVKRLHVRAHAPLCKKGC